MLYVCIVGMYAAEYTVVSTCRTYENCISYDTFKMHESQETQNGYVT